MGLYVDMHFEISGFKLYTKYHDISENNITAMSVIPQTAETPDIWHLPHQMFKTNSWDSNQPHRRLAVMPHQLIVYCYMAANTDFITNWLMARMKLGSTPKSDLEDAELQSETSLSIMKQQVFG